MSRFSPGIAPTANRPLDFSPLSNALDSIEKRRSDKRREEIEDADLQLKIRGAGGRPTEPDAAAPFDPSGGRAQHGGLDRAIDAMHSGIAPARTAMMPPPTQRRPMAPSNQFVYPLPEPTVTPGYEDTGTDGRGGHMRVELGGAHSPALSHMPASSGRSVADYLRPYKMSIRGQEYEFDPMQPARVKAAQTGIEDDAEIERMRGLGMSSEEISRSKYPDRSFTFPERRELKEMDLASRSALNTQRERISRLRLRLEERKIGMLEAARNNTADYAQQRIAYLRDRLAFDKAYGEASLAMREYGIDAGQLGRADRDTMDDDALVEAEREIASARKRAQDAGKPLRQGAGAGAATGAPNAAPRTQPARDSVSTKKTPANPYRR